MTPREAREKVLSIMPQARYMHLSPNLDRGHCIDDDYNDRYLAYDCKSRSTAWVTAYKFLTERGNGER